MEPVIDWHALAGQVGTLHDTGERGGDDCARRALELLIGEEKLRATVDYYITHRPGGELARSVLHVVRSWAAMQRCYELIQTSIDPEVRQTAIELLRFISDERALAWVGEFLDDPDPDIQTWSMEMIDELLWSGLVSSSKKIETLLNLLAFTGREESRRVRRRADAPRRPLGFSRGPSILSSSVASRNGRLWRLPTIAASLSTGLAIS
jgi:hypothetical protein